MILFTLPACGKCQILKSRLLDCGAVFEVIDDVAELRRNGIIGGIPKLKVNDKMMEYREAIDFISSSY
jgi:hypothetical protein